ncbi:MAG: MAPEG family protein [Hyphomonadaceae bacterium]|nr:MAPEG family protein [Hyphomonadaceae bacterium]
MYEHGFLAPVVALIIWSMVILIWLYLTRIPAMSKAKLKPDGKLTRNDMDNLPGTAPNVASNYNHLMEQPTIFYATCLVLQFLGLTDANLIGWAWAYVALRVLHSLVQNTVNIIMLRFSIFVVSSIVLGVLVYHAAIGVGLISFG